MLTIVGGILSRRAGGGLTKSTVAMADTLAKIPDVEIDPEGTFKYILIRVKIKDGDVNKDIVRGTKSAEYHSKLITACYSLLQREVRQFSLRERANRRANVLYCCSSTGRFDSLTRCLCCSLQTCMVYSYCTNQTDASLTNKYMFIANIRGKSFTRLDAKLMIITCNF